MTIATDSHSRSTSSSWCEEKTTGTPSSASPCSTPLSTSTPTGSSPENGSSSTSSSGPCTSAAPSWTRCWLPSESDSTRSPARSAIPSRSSQPVGGLGRRGARQAVQRGEVGELVAHAHLRVEAALLRHVAEAGARLEVDRPAAPADLAAVGLEHAEDDPHRRRLAGAVRPHEAEELSRLDAEGEVVERDDVAVAARQVDHLEHPHRDSESRRRMSGGYRPPAPKVVVYMAAWRGLSCGSGASKAKPDADLAVAGLEHVGAVARARHPQRDDRWPACSWRARPRRGSPRRGSADSPGGRCARRAARRRGCGARRTCAWPCRASAARPPAASTAFSVSATRPWRARSALIRHSVAARTCASLAGTGRSHEPAQPSTSGLAATAAPGPPQPVRATAEEQECKGGPHPTGIVMARSELEVELADFGRLVLALQPLAAPLDRGDELREVDLERVEDLVGVVLRAEPDLALAGAGVLDDVLRLALGLLGDLLLGRRAPSGARAPP